MWGPPGGERRKPVCCPGARAPDPRARGWRLNGQELQVACVRCRWGERARHTGRLAPDSSRELVQKSEARAQAFSSRPAEPESGLLCPACFHCRVNLSPAGWVPSGRGEAHTRAETLWDRQRFPPAAWPVGRGCGSIRSGRWAVGETEAGGAAPARGRPSPEPSRRAGRGDSAASGHRPCAPPAATGPGRGCWSCGAWGVEVGAPGACRV